MKKLLVTSLSIFSLVLILQCSLAHAFKLGDTVRYPSPNNPSYLYDATVEKINLDGTMQIRWIERSENQIWSETAKVLYSSVVPYHQVDSLNGYKVGTNVRYRSPNNPLSFIHGTITEIYSDGIMNMVYEVQGSEGKTWPKYMQVRIPPLSSEKISCEKVF